MLARQGKYDSCLFHRLVPGFMVRIVIYVILCNLAMACRFNQETRLAQAQVANRIGEHHSATSMT